MPETITSIPKPIAREDAVASLRIALGFLATSRPVWTAERPTRPGYYWVRDDARISRPYVVEVRLDYSEKGVPLVVQEWVPENTGVQWLLCSRYDRCLWAGPIEEPLEPFDSRSIASA